jgi:putative glycosyltransferase (TIGR04372 family)
MSRFPPTLSFAKGEIERAQELMLEMAIPKGSKWVCIHNRDSAYLRTEYPLSDYSYHDYRDTDIEDYELAMLALADLGYYVIRMGKFVEKGLSLNHPMIIDYASSDYRQDFLDVYIAAKCSFFVSSGSGIDGVANIFRRPQLYVNLALPLHALTNKHDHMFIYKHFLDATSKQKLSLNDLLTRGISGIVTSQAFVDAAIELRSNSPLEIMQAVLDMDKFLRNGFTIDDIDLEHQRAFWGAFPRIADLHGSAPFRATIGPSFLRENLHLLQ